MKNYLKKHILEEIKYNKIISEEIVFDLFLLFNEIVSFTYMSTSIFFQK